MNSPNLNFSQKIGIGVWAIAILVLVAYLLVYGDGHRRVNLTLVPRVSGKIEGDVYYLKTRGNERFEEVDERQYNFALSEDKYDVLTTYTWIVMVLGAIVGFRLVLGPKGKYLFESPLGAKNSDEKSGL